VFWLSAPVQCEGGKGIPLHGSLAVDSMPKACHIHAMANLQVKNVPDTLHQRLRRYAHEHKCTLSDVVLIALERELTRREWHERLAQRPTTDLGASAASLLEQERQQRERDPT
jgi:plasmid stability protein